MHLLGFIIRNKIKSKLLGSQDIYPPVQITAGYSINSGRTWNTRTSSEWPDNKWCTMNKQNQIHKCRGKNGNHQDDALYQQTGLKLREELRCYTWSTAFYNAKLADTSENRSIIPGKLWNVVQGKDGADHLNRSCEKWRSIPYSQEGRECPIYT
jgi:hypothetical protein